MTLTSHVPGTPAPAGTTAAPATDTASASGRIELRLPDGWFAVCDTDRIVPGRGVAAVLPDGSQVAVFLDRTGKPYAIGNRDPFTGAYVLSRGLLGSADGAPFVSSPLLKQRFGLETGRCLDDDAVSVPAYDCRTTR